MSQNLQSDDSSVQQVLAFARAKIINGEYPPNTKLLPKILAEECGTSLIPVREAMRALESDGIVTFINNRGAWVSPISINDLNDLYSVRIPLEMNAVETAIDLTPEDIKKLREILDRSDEAMDSNNKAAVVKLNKDFHFAIYSHSKSPWRLRLIETLWSHAERYQRLSLNYRKDPADKEHHDIVDALAEHDNHGAAKAMGFHLKTTVELLNKSLKKSNISEVVLFSF